MIRPLFLVHGTDRAMERIDDGRDSLPSTSRERSMIGDVELVDDLVDVNSDDEMYECITMLSTLYLCFAAFNCNLCSIISKVRITYVNNIWAT